jgi:hypothetical protein
LGDDLVRLGGGSRRRIAQFTSHDQKRLTVYDQLTSSIHHPEVWRLDGPKAGARETAREKKTRSAKKDCTQGNRHEASNRDTTAT